VGRAQRALLYRKTAAFDFTMLGPRVPAVVISPRIRAGAVDSRARDHASIPATLRALFAPDKEPLTARDRWSPPFHGLLTLPEGRTGLPDLSQYATGPATRIADAALAETVPTETVPTETVPTETVPTETMPAEPLAVPRYYESFLALAGQVQAHLAAVGEPEVVGLPAGPEALRGTRVTQAFTAAADRHRQSR
jgi:phospholipase C